MSKWQLVKVKQGGHRFEFICPLTRLEFWVPILDPSVKKSSTDMWSAEFRGALPRFEDVVAKLGADLAALKESVKFRFPEGPKETLRPF